MKIACQTIIWGHDLRDAEPALAAIRALGFDGVEFCQPPGLLPPAAELKKYLTDYNLELLGFYGGRLEDRQEYARICGAKYLCIEDWISPQCDLAVGSGFTLALHPHMFRRVASLKAASDLLAKHNELLLIPDVAHLSVAGDDPCDAIRRYAGRLAAVHLKDWTPKYGRSYHRYSRGFVELGQGMLDLKKILKTLRDIQYDGWLVIEQDSSATSPESSCRASLEWLRREGLTIPTSAVSVPLPRPKIDTKENDKLAAKAAPVFTRIMRTPGTDIRDIGRRLLDALPLGARCVMASVSEYSPTKDILSLMASWPLDCQAFLPFVESCRDTTTGRTVDSQCTTLYSGEDINRFFCWRPDVTVEGLGIRQAVSVPVFNRYSSSQVELVVNVFYRDLSPSRDQLVKLFTQYAEYLSIAYEAAVEDACLSASAMVTLSASQHRDVGSFLDSVVKILQTSLYSEGVTVFLLHETRQRMEPRASTGLRWRDEIPEDEHYYRMGQGLTGRVWETGQAQVTVEPHREPGYEGRSSEKVAIRTKTSLCVPLKDPEGQIRGLIRCVNKHSPGQTAETEMFCQSDLSVVDAVAQTMAPNLDVLMADERRRKTFTRLTHELKVPVQVVQGAVEAMRREMRDTGYRFKYPYLDDIDSWQLLARRLLMNIDHVQYRFEPLPVRVERVYLLRDVFAPARNQLEPLLRERNFSKQKITDDGFAEIPSIWVDRTQMQQVFFNLLSNAIKYSYSDPNAFQVDIETRCTPAGFELCFRDQGAGIPSGYEKLIFDEGVRGPGAEEVSVGGDGLGLWIAARILQAHGGDITVSSPRRPTEFLIRLPEKLLNKWC